MAKIQQEDLDKSLEFECARCGAKCVRVSPIEPEYGYISKADGSFVGPLCTECINILPKNDVVAKKIWATAFIIGVLPDGEGIVLTENGIAQPYLRDATLFDIESACTHVLRDLQSGKTAHKFAEVVAQINAPTRIVK